MTLQALAITNLKQKIFMLVDQLPVEQLPKLLSLLERWLEQDNAPETNGAILKSPSTSGERTEADQPWLKYTARLKDSPNWDEFLDALAQARHADEAEASR
ncbi:MAG: hypothetical protein U0350_02880 [Caldilineaceae bacterium]